MKPIVTKFSYEQCPQETCDCIAPTTQVLNSDLSVGAFSKVLAIGSPTAPITITKTAGPDWLLASVVGNEIKIEGTASAGKDTFVFDVENECGKACVVITVSTVAPCAPSPSITTDISIVLPEKRIDQIIEVPDGSVIVSDTFPSEIQVSAYGKSLTIMGNFQGQPPSNYGVTLKDDCGQYTVSGNISICKQLSATSMTGSLVFERGEPVNYCWLVDGTAANAEISSVVGLPPGVVATIEVISPLSVRVCLSGIPSDNPCPDGNCTAVVNIKNNCSALKLSTKYKQQPCRALRVVGETGSSAFALGQAANFCRIVEGYGQPDITSFENVPKGLTVSVSPFLDSTNAVVKNKWLVCVTGTLEEDLCKSYAVDICECATVKIKNECGEVDVQMCSNIKGEASMPKYCIGLVTITPVGVGTVGAGANISVRGVVPGTDVAVEVKEVGSGILYNSKTLTADGSGNIAAQFVSASGGALNVHCFTVSHPSCVLISDTRIISNCTAPAPDLGQGGA